VPTFNSVRTELLIRRSLRAVRLRSLSFRASFGETAPKPRRRREAEGEREGAAESVREANAALPAERRIRVLLGDPPMDWENIRGKGDFRKWVVQRDSYPADLVRRQVLARNRRALLVYANGHLLRQEILTNNDMSNWQAQSIVSLIEAPGGAPVFTVRTDGSLSKWHFRRSVCRIPTSTS
jgi:hypothetical protein